MTKNNTKNILDWNIQELSFRPIDFSIDTNRINTIKININDDDKINQQNDYFIKTVINNKGIMPLSFNLRHNTQIDYDFNFSNLYNDESNSLINNFICDSISDQNSYLYNFRKSFLDKKVNEIKIDSISDDLRNSIKLGEKDPWAM